MKSWPLPNSYADTLPSDGDRGSYWEDRQIGFNCGIDLFCPSNSDVFLIESGTVLNISTFTQKNELHCFENTLQCVIKCNSIIYKYCFLTNINLELGQKVESGSKIGVCGNSIDIEKIKDTDPFYLREIAHTNHISLLHLELLKAPIMEVRPYNYGNFLGESRPNSLINPVLFLSGLTKNKQI